ncbi:hypothetical protein [Actinomadura gamaensis]|uniref:Uncharacterized protein n=1 Tax=Actinomadura gamaensis TaxID=1763541 RepID=A0ABV9TP53_9ACTN
MTAPALHRGMLAVDIVAFGTRRDPDVQLHLRASIHGLTERTCAAAGVSWKSAHHEDRGDGLYLIAEPGTGPSVLLTRLVPELLSEVRRHNKLASAVAQLRLRVAVHAGFVQLDRHGATGTSLTELFRLLEAPAFRTVMADPGTDLAVVVSDYLYREVVQHDIHLAGGFTAIPVEVKEALMRGWVWVPPSPTRASADLGSPSPTRTSADLVPPELRFRTPVTQDRRLILTMIAGLVELLDDTPGKPG